MPPLSRLLVALGAAAVVLAPSGCGPAGQSREENGRGACPVDPIDVTVSVDQWTDLVRTLGGDCTRVTTVVDSTTSDPHEYEPTPADTAALQQADAVVLNGLGYDEWARKATAATTADRRCTVELARGAGRTNPHAFYDPQRVEAAAPSVTRMLTTCLGGTPAVRRYLDGRADRWSTATAPYRAAIARTRTAAQGRSYAATEPVAEDLAAAVGLRDRTPDGFARAAANETEPAPGDVADLLALLRTRRVDVLLLNTQREGALNDEIARAARDAGVPVVGITETVPPGTDGFVAWQVGQLRRIADALARGTGR